MLSASYGLEHSIGDILSTAGVIYFLSAAISCIISLMYIDICCIILLYLSLYQCYVIDIFFFRCVVILNGVISSGEPDSAFESTAFEYK